MIHLLNAFSAGMLDGETTSLTFAAANVNRVRRLCSNGVQSHVGHADTAALLAAMLETPVPMTRDSFSFAALPAGDVVIVAQYNGARLPEGATSLPEGAKIVFFEVYRVTWGGMVA